MMQETRMSILAVSGSGVRSFRSRACREGFARVFRVRNHPDIMQGFGGIHPGPTGFFWRF